MFSVVGKLKSKTIIKEGVSEKGGWRIIEFTIIKMFNEEPVVLAFVALGNIAETVNRTPIGKRLLIRFVPKCKVWNNKWYTELKVLTLEEYRKAASQPLSQFQQPQNGNHAPASTAKPEMTFEEEIKAGIVNPEGETVEQINARLAKADADLPFPTGEDGKLSREELIKKGMTGGKKSKRKPF